MRNLVTSLLASRRLGRGLWSFALAMSWIAVTTKTLALYPDLGETTGERLGYGLLLWVSGLYLAHSMLLALRRHI